MATQQQKPQEGREQGFVSLANSCSDTKGKIEWKNRKFEAEVCATDEADAAAKVDDAKIKATVKSAAQRAIGDLGCAEIPGCSPPKVCRPGEVRVRHRVVVDPEPDNCTDTEAQGTCPAGQTVWKCTFRADVVAEQSCECVAPA